MVMVETSVRCEFPATVPCLRPLDYFFGWGATTFQRALSAHVCDLVLLRGLYFRRETHRHPKTKLKVTISQTDHSVLCLGCSGAVKTGTFSSLTLLTFERVFWNRRLNLQWDWETFSSYSWEPQSTVASAVTGPLSSKRMLQQKAAIILCWMRNQMSMMSHHSYWRRHWIESSNPDWQIQ